MHTTYPSRMIVKKLYRTGLGACVLSAMGALQPLWAALPAGPAPQVPDGGAAPGDFPNTTVTAVNVQAKGSTVFDSSVDVPGFNGQGPVAWSLNRYNRGDFSLRLAPADPTAALTSLGLGFIEYADTDPATAANQAWRPSPIRGIVIPTASQNGPIDWQDGEGPFYPTVAIAESSSGPGFNMVDGSYGNGNLDLNTGRAGTHSSSPEANFSFSATWFPYDQGWLGGEIGAPTDEGVSQWTNPNAHAAGLTAGLVQWLQYPEGSGLYGGLARLTLPGVDSLENGMLFTVSSDGSSDANISGVTPIEEGKAWLVTLRERLGHGRRNPGLGVPIRVSIRLCALQRSAPGGRLHRRRERLETQVRRRLCRRPRERGHVRTDAPRQDRRGWHALAASGRSGKPVSPNPSLPARSCRTNTSTANSSCRRARRSRTPRPRSPTRASTSPGWTSPPRWRPRPDRALRNQAAVAVSGEGVSLQRSRPRGQHRLPPKCWWVTYDSQNLGGYQGSHQRRLRPIRPGGPIPELAHLGAGRRPVRHPSQPGVGSMSRNDVKYNPVSKQYVVVANARGFNATSHDVVMIALVNPASAAQGGAPVAKAFVHDPETDQSYDDIAVAVSSKNGNFLLVAERKFDGEGEGTVGALYDKSGKLLNTALTRLDPLQTVGDEDDPDVVYLAERDAFLYLSNTDNSNGSTGTPEQPDRRLHRRSRAPTPRATWSCASSNRWRTASPRARPRATPAPS